jgi:very-short-patch-repair endonuclease
MAVNTRTTLADDQRTRWLNAQGYEVIRFWNNDVLSNIEGC